MGKEFFRRPLAVAGATGGSTVSSFDDLRVAGALAAVGTVTLSGSLVVPVETKSAANSMTALSAYGVSFLNTTSSTKLGGFKLPAPPAAGAIKDIYIDVTSSTAPEAVFRIVTAATADANTFWGTTYNEVKATGSTVLLVGSYHLSLVGKSTAQWVLGVPSTALFDVLGSTGSTAGP